MRSQMIDADESTSTLRERRAHRHVAMVARGSYLTCGFTELAVILVDNAAQRVWEQDRSSMGPAHEAQCVAIKCEVAYLGAEVIWHRH